MEVLLYVDPSPRGEWALGLGALLPEEYAHGFCLLATEEDTTRQSDLLDLARGRLGREKGVREAVRPGPAEAAVVREAHEARYGLILVPPAGRGALRRLLQGSRVATVVRSVETPVIVARRPPRELTRVLAAVSGERGSPAVATAAAALASALGARCTWLHVTSDVALPYHDPTMTPVELGPRDVLLAAQAAVHDVEPGAELAVREGLVVDEILDEFESGAHHILVVGGQDEEEAAAWGREDVTERLLLGCPGSTFIIPRRTQRER